MMLFDNRNYLKNGFISQYKNPEEGSEENGSTEEFVLWFSDVSRFILMVQVSK